MLLPFLPGPFLRLQQSLMDHSHVPRLFLPLPFELVAHLLMKLVALVIHESSKLVLPLFDLQKRQPSFQHFLLVIGLLQLPQRHRAILLILCALTRGKRVARLELGFQLLQLSAALLRFCAIEVDLLLGDVPYHFITSNNIKKGPSFLLFTYHAVLKSLVSVSLRLGARERHDWL